MKISEKDRVRISGPVEAQLSFFIDFLEETAVDLNKKRIELLPLDEYDRIIISYSGGKDSICGLLYFLEQGVPKEKIELWHQSIDGEPGTAELFADWPVTESYVKATGEALGIKTRFQWRDGGFKGELLRENRMSHGIGFETEDNILRLPTLKGKISTRRKFPAKTMSLSTRWCSSSLKIEVFTKALTNFPDLKGDLFNPLKILVFTGERREESHARAKYNETELHHCSTRSHIIHAWRTVIDYTELDVWRLIEKYKITPHPAYILGFSRTSCMSCIFSHPDHWAMQREFAPERFNLWRQMEIELGFTIDSKFNLEEMANRGSIKRLPKNYRDSKWVKMALSSNFTVKDFFTVGTWNLPAGAFKGAEGGAV